MRWDEPSLLQLVGALDFCQKSAQISKCCFLCEIYARGTSVLRPFSEEDAHF